MMKARDLPENPANWRKHPPEQLAALQKTLERVGWAGALLFNSRTNRLIDGHARRSIAKPDDQLPVLVIDVDEAREREILLTLDPLAAMATADGDQLQALFDAAPLPDLAEFTPLIDQLNAQLEDEPLPRLKPKRGKSADRPPASHEGYKILIDCTDEKHQLELLKKFEAEKIQAKALIA